jgi:hypothetical protein
MWDLLVAILEVFMDSSIVWDTKAPKRRARPDLPPEFRDLKQAQQAQSAVAESAHTPAPMQRPATRRRLAKRTRRSAVPPHA